HRIHRIHRLHTSVLSAVTTRLPAPAVNKYLPGPLCSILLCHAYCCISAYSHLDTPASTTARGHAQHAHSVISHSVPVSDASQIPPSRINTPKHPPSPFLSTTIRRVPQHSQGLPEHKPRPPPLPLAVIPSHHRHPNMASQGVCLLSLSPMLQLPNERLCLPPQPPLLIPHLQLANKNILPGARGLSRLCTSSSLPMSLDSSLSIALRRPALRVKDENQIAKQQPLKIVSTKSKVVNALKGGAKRTALGDVSNATKTHARKASNRQPLAPKATRSRTASKEIDMITTSPVKKEMDIDTIDKTHPLPKCPVGPECLPADQVELAAIRQHFVDEKDEWDTTMVAEYSDEIFDYMHELEAKMMPTPGYMSQQNEIEWSMRSILIDWLIQVHARFHLLPETLFLCINYIDRFLSSKLVSLQKLQLVGATALFVAAKYEEIQCPSVHEIVYMVDHGYTADEILKAERFMVNMLNFELGYPGPMSFLRRISKADDYDLDTRTLAKYVLEVTLMDERFVGALPSFAAAASHCLSRRMLSKGEWTPAHVFYSGYTESQLSAPIEVLLDCLRYPTDHHSAVYEKYSDRKFKKAARFVEEWMLSEEHV
ncbi:G2/mitotic-specific cyclin-4, partial [Neolecta irregularis DAH-3]